MKTKIYSSERDTISFTLQKKRERERERERERSYCDKRQEKAESRRYLAMVGSTGNAGPGQYACTTGFGW